MATVRPNSVEDQKVGSLCPVCGRANPSAKRETDSKDSDTSTGNQICDACKKFYSRYRGKLTNKEKCSCGGKNNTGTCCRLCRFRRCETALLGDVRNDLTGEKVDFTKLPCAVCGVSSSGFHFGVVSCEGCKGFFRRSMKKDYKIQYTCKEGGKVLCPTSSNCRKCRLQRCLDAGMSLKEITIGRHTLRRQAQVDAAIRKHTSQGSFLKEKILRRYRGEREEVKSEPRSQTNSLDLSSTKTVPSERERGNSQQSVFENGETSTTAKIQQDEGTRDMALPSSSIIFPKPPNSNFESTCDNSEATGNSADDLFEKSNDWFIKMAVSAAAKLSGISEVRVVLENGATEQQFLSARFLSIDSYVRCISQFMTSLPGTNRISLADRIVLFSEAFPAISTAQLSLHFDVERQMPNHFSLDRVGPAWELSARTSPVIHFAIENFLIEAGNRLVATIRDLPEFSLFCALLLLNPAAPNLENVDAVRSILCQYDLALVHYLSKESGVTSSETRRAEIYQLLSFFRRSTLVLQDILEELNTRRLGDKIYMTGIFRELLSHIFSVSSPSSSIAASPP